MRRPALVVLCLLALTSALAAPVAHRSDWSAALGLERTEQAVFYRGEALSPDKATRLDAFIARLEAAPEQADALLAETASRRLEAGGYQLDAPAPDGKVWFERAPSGMVLTAAGRKAVPGIILEEPAAPLIPHSAASAPQVPARKIEEMLAGLGQVDFDNAAARGADAAAVAAGTMGTLAPAAEVAAGTIGTPAPAAEVAAGTMGALAPAAKASGREAATTEAAPAVERLDAGRAAGVAPPAEAKPGFFGRVKSFFKDLLAKPEEPAGAGEKALFYSTKWAYHLSWVADFITTGMIIAKGGYEKNAMYTLFGASSMTGVILSALVVHVGLSLLSWYLYKKSLRSEGLSRRLLQVAAVGINVGGVLIHVLGGVVPNIKLLRSWGR